MDAEAYLTDGFGVRLSIEAKPSGWVRFGEVARATAPPRIKQVLVSRGHGVPYLNTSQVFDLRPAPRKWLAMQKTTKASERLVKEGTILVMASATVGRAIVATKAHEDAIVSHHFMRVTPLREELAGWVYAFLRSTQAQSMMKGSQYASLVRHIEPHHLEALPMPQVTDSIAEAFQKKVADIVACRNNAARLRSLADETFEKAVGAHNVPGGEDGFSVRASAAFSGRRRLEAAYHAPRVRAIIQGFGKWERLGEIASRVWWPNRFKRQYLETGTPYMSADDVFTTNPYSLKSVLVEAKKDRDECAVEPNWILMARSGQTYGLNGSATLTTEYHRNFLISDDLIRIAPDPAKARAGYLLVALTHPALGRPIVIREAYGMSIPHLDPDDVAAIPIVRLGKKAEDAIADLAERSVAEQARAEVLEREISEEASAAVSEFLMQSDTHPMSGDADDVEIARARIAEIDEHPDRILRGEDLAARMAQWES